MRLEDFKNVQTFTPSNAMIICCNEVGEKFCGDFVSAEDYKRLLDYAKSLENDKDKKED